MRESRIYTFFQRPQILRSDVQAVTSPAAWPPIHVEYQTPEFVVFFDYRPTSSEIRRWRYPTDRDDVRTK